MVKIKLVDRDGKAIGENTQYNECSDCGEEINEDVKYCSGCGEDQRNIFARYKILTATITLVLIMALIVIVKSAMYYI